METPSPARQPARLATANARFRLGVTPMKLLRRLALAGTFLAYLAAACTGQDSGKKDKIPDKVSYYKDVRPLFQQHCQGCHQPAKAQGGYVMTDFAELL